MATIKKSAKSAPKMTKPVAPARKGNSGPKMAPMPPMQGPPAPQAAPQQGLPMMKKGGSVEKTIKGKKAVKSFQKMGKKKATISISKK
jgi:hypothetical protein